MEVAAVVVVAQERRCSSPTLRRWRCATAKPRNTVRTELAEEQAPMLKMSPQRLVRPLKVARKRCVFASIVARRTCNKVWVAVVHSSNLFPLFCVFRARKARRRRAFSASSAL